MRLSKQEVEEMKDQRNQPATTKTERELRAALKQTLAQYETDKPCSPNEHAAWKVAYNADLNAAAAKNEPFWVGCVGPALEEHERVWVQKEARYKVLIQTLEWALGMGELPKCG